MARRFIVENKDILDYLSEELKVSNRTIYREISSLESTLAKYQIKLVRELDIGYRLVGKPAMFSELQKQLYGSPNELTAQQRQSALVIKLLMQEHEVKMESLALDLQVSISTIQADLVSIEDVFKAYKIDIERKKAKGIQAVASESSRRLIISGLIHSEINEYDFFQLMESGPKGTVQNWEAEQNPFLKRSRLGKVEVFSALGDSAQNKKLSFIEEIDCERLFDWFLAKERSVEHGAEKYD